MLNWANRFDICCFLDNHQYNIHPHRFDCLLAVGSHQTFTAGGGDSFNKLRQFSTLKKDWLFGHFSYDLKNELESLESRHPDNINFPDAFFFVPETVIIITDGNIIIQTTPGIKGEQIISEIMSEVVVEIKRESSFEIKSRLTKEDYLQKVRQLQQHILLGDCYEINFCQEFYQEAINIQPLETYWLLSELSPNPFGGYYKLFDKYVLCASPERYLAKRNNNITSQPMKGTSRRDLNYSEADERIKQDLHASSKDRSENVMVVDLVRNDLSKVCQEGTVKVEALYSILSFPQVHQMVSTISGVVKEGLHWTDCIKATFPMGSMTGAPKKRVMQLIEQYEQSRRGIFSGTIGYITPEQDFDFNVVIRSILYNNSKKYLSYQVGSGITFYSNPEKEYEECLLKAEAIKKVLT